MIVRHLQLPDGLADRAIRIIRERYPDFGPTFSDEKLRECHGRILTWRVMRKVSGVLTVQCDRVIYLLEDTPANPALVHRCIDVVEHAGM